MAQDLKFSLGPFPEWHNWHRLANHIIVIVDHGGWKRLPAIMVYTHCNALLRSYSRETKKGPVIKHTVSISHSATDWMHVCDVYSVSTYLDA